MKVLLTGAFGNVGSSTIPELLRQGHSVRCFDLKTKVNEKAARRYAGQIEVVWGDITDPTSVSALVKERDVVIHIAAIIPPTSEVKPQLAYKVNVEGTRNVIAALKAEAEPARLIFSSSVSIFGVTQALPPPRTINDPLAATDHYTHHKIACEEMIRASRLTFTILRFGAVPPMVYPFSPLLLRTMFESHLDSRIEFVHTYDVALALTNAVSTPAVWGKTLLIGAGPAGQMRMREYIGDHLEAMGIGRLPEKAFSQKPFYTDWMDTTESQELLKYQRYTYADFVKQSAALLGYQRYMVYLFRPLIRRFILRYSPYLHDNAKTPS